jgi:multiple sugar transport system permease protein
VLIGVPLTMILALAVAVGLNTGITRFTTFFRVGYYLPVVTSIVAIAVVWRLLLEPDSGIINTLLGYVGVDGPSWLNDKTWAMPP